MDEILALFAAVLAPTQKIWLSEGLIEFLMMKTLCTEFKKDDIVLKKGQVANYMYYVQKGVIAGCTIGEDEKETYTWFMNEGNLAVSVDSFYGQIPTTEAIIAIKDCVVFMMSREDLEYAYIHFLEFNYIGRVLTEQYYRMGFLRENNLRKLDAARCLIAMLGMQPWLLERVPARKIASFLGISEEALSRTRKQHQAEIEATIAKFDKDQDKG